MVYVCIFNLDERRFGSNLLSVEKEYRNYNVNFNMYIIQQEFEIVNKILDCCLYNISVEL